ncbi:MAG: ABC transporter permease [Anaerolineae bacterium]
MPSDLKGKIIQSSLPVLIPLGAVALALVIGAIMLLALGADPIKAYQALFEGAFGNTNAFADTLVRATPLLLVGVGICISFRGGVFNIGGEGQFIIGAIGAAALALYIEGLPGWVIIILSLTLGALGGAVWGGIPGALKASLNVNEILSTIMMNAIAVQIMNFLLSGPLIDPAQIEKGTFLPETARLPNITDLPRLIPTRLHLGAAIAVLLAILVWILLWRTTVGYRIRAVGLNPFASRYAGIPVNRYAMLALTFSGALAGLAGAVQVLGVHHRLLTDGSAAGFTNGVGFDGIVAALFGGLHPLGTIPASVLFGGLLVGANKLQRVVQVPSSLAVALNGLVVIFVVSSQIWRYYLSQKLAAAQAAEASQPEVKTPEIRERTS